jgi:hypothetical protein
MLADSVLQNSITFDFAVAGLAECKRRGVVLAATPTGVRGRAPRDSMTSELSAAILENRDDVRQVLLSVDWPAGVGVAADFALLLTTDDLPAAPFGFGPGCMVVDVVKFLAALRSDIRRGPHGPRARPGGVVR